MKTKIRHLSNYLISMEPDLLLAQSNPSWTYKCPNIDECLRVVPRPILHPSSFIYNYRSWLFQLRYLQTLNSISAENNSTIIFPVPIDVLSEFMPHSPASNYQSTGFKKNCKIVIDATFKFEFKLVSSLWLKTTLYVTFFNCFSSFTRRTCHSTIQQSNGVEQCLQQANRR